MTFPPFEIMAASLLKETKYLGKLQERQGQMDSRRYSRKNER